MKTFYFKKSARLFSGLALLMACLLIRVSPLLAQDWASLRDELAPGMELAVLPFTTELGISEELAILRLDPSTVSFDLLMCSELGISPLSPKDWAEKYDLAAVINASMYLGNGNTSTGYMRHGDFVNNSKIASRFGAFFVTNPRANGAGAQPDQAISSANRSTAILDRDADDWAALLPFYDSVVQNFRIIDGNGRTLWGDSDKRHSVAVLGEDDQGFIYFIHTPGMVTVPEFVRVLNTLPVKFCRLMYVEGGRPAALHIRTPKLNRTWLGRYANFLQSDDQAVLLPNVIAVRSKVEPAVK